VIIHSRQENGGMASPIVTGVLDNGGLYLEGQPMTLTVTYSDADAETGSLTVMATDSAGNSTTITIPYSVSDPVAVVAGDSNGREVTKISDDGATAVFTATA
jgi:hypothetical protein